MKSKEIRKILRNMKNYERIILGKYDIFKIHNKYVFSELIDYAELVNDDTSYIATVGEKQAINWILESYQKKNNFD